MFELKDSGSSQSSDANKCYGTSDQAVHSLFQGMNYIFHKIMHKILVLSSVFALLHNLINS